MHVRSVLIESITIGEVQSLQGHAAHQKSFHRASVTWTMESFESGIVSKFDNRHWSWKCGPSPLQQAHRWVYTGFRLSH